MSQQTAKKQEKATLFTPVHPFNMDDPRSCLFSLLISQRAQLTASDKIVFSKRSLLEFMKSCQLTVDTNFSQIQKLYATFGRFNKAATDAAVADLVDAEIADPTTDSSVPSSKSTVPRPTRKVIDPPGGKQSLRIFGEEYEEEDALSLAPPRDGGDGVDVEVERLERLKLHVEPEVDGGAHIEDANPPPGFRPTRKVRQGPGGASSMGAAMFGGFEDETESDRQEARAQTGGKKQQPQAGGTGLW